MQSIGQIIRYWRKHANLTATELGKKLGIENHRMMSQYENDYKSIKLERLIKIAETLKAPKEHFLRAHFQKQLIQIGLDKRYEVTVSKK